MTKPPNERSPEHTSPGYNVSEPMQRQRTEQRLASDEAPRGQGGHCATIPELGTLPFIPQRTQGQRVARLISHSQGSELSIELQPGLNKVGRQRNGNHIVLVSGEVSRLHAEVVVSDDGVRVRDLGSSNGTFVNEQRITDQKLEVGDIVAFSQQFSFQLLIDSVPAQQAQAARPAASSGAAGPSPLPPIPDRALEPPPLSSAPEEDFSAANPTPPDGESSLHRVASQVLELQEGAVAAGSPELAELAALERERRQLSLLYQVSKRCMSAESLAELDRLLIEVIERMVRFDRGFITYQLPSGDWKLVMSPRGDRWDRTVVRNLLQVGLKLKAPLCILDSSSDDKLGSLGPGRSDSRLLMPLRTRTNPVGVAFLITSQRDSFDGSTVDFLALFFDIAALAVANCSRVESQRG